MVTKIQAAKDVGQFGVPTLIMNGETPHQLTHVFTGEGQGTLFLPQGRRLPSRKALDRLYPEDPKDNWFSMMVPSKRYDTVEKVCCLLAS